jgi:hypothetical protein
VSPATRTDYGQFQAAITPLLHPTPHAALSASDYTWIEQFSDVTFQHPLNDGRSASLALSMYDPIVTNLRPFQQAVVLLYIRPGVDPEDAERVIWGPCNVIDNYDAGTVTLNIQDPSGRLQHHYLRVGDDALNVARAEGKGQIPADDRGVATLVKAGTFGTPPEPGIPAMGLATRGRMANRTLIQEVERGQEVWAMITLISETVGGPDFDLKPNYNLDGSLPPSAVSVEGRCYSVLWSYNPPFSTALTGAQLQRDLSATAIFEYGQPQDNVKSITVTPQRPANDVIVVDSAQSVRTRAQYPEGMGLVGVYQDWLSPEIKAGYDPWDLIEQFAIANLNSWARPLNQVDLELRPDSGQDFFYGDPELASFGTVGDFYLGDMVTLRAVRGNRSFEGVYRIVNVELTMSGSRGPITTKLTVVPYASASLDENVVTAETIGTQSR